MPPRRRTVFFVAVIGVLHVVALHWLGGQAGRAPAHEQAQLVSMAVIAEAPAPLPVPLPPPPVPLPPPPAPDRKSVV